jgi:drug/metabolite transporter (DMT)-like permease
MSTQGDAVVTTSSATRRWTVIASGLLVLALALVVIYTRPGAFLSPVALVVVSAIGLAALLLQVRFRRDLPEVRSPLWLNVLGVLSAVASLLGDYLHLTRSTLDVMAFGAVGCFGISGTLILHALRRQVPTKVQNPSD